jgi:hypothetical protein
LNDFAAALRDLNEAGIRYVIVGGLAVIRNGVVRATKDVDAAVAMDDENLSRLDAIVERWAATNPDGTPLRESCRPAAHWRFVRGIAWWTSCPSSFCPRRLKPCWAGLM